MCSCLSMGYSQWVTVSGDDLFIMKGTVKSCYCSWFTCWLWWVQVWSAVVGRVIRFRGSCDGVAMRNNTDGSCYGLLRICQWYDWV